ncbi:hypothetical protein COS59_01135 [Candidatus Wolfebacteria bacterium CG03_land_8_20_14_0_80_36_15]|uniref:DUF4921 domain-containing protein n=1 Tax=Candidatus Wolfebacteria bacterium CG03_land_8_20_14_0_80_36_15 TaxID=1975067 RepID=A0A2M7B7T4_9BACT|nr:MAG: hypothetical protein COS59_01135 [Candidatus Wolfebacteria bacterium CG03_land_8_20_14_0_80_36_15]
MNSDLRQDLVSGDWVMIAPGRLPKGPKSLIKKMEKRKRSPKKGCVFCDPKREPGKLLFSYPNKTDWQIKIIENKYPAVRHNKKHARFFKKGPYQLVEGIGHHEVLITKDHDKNFAHLNKEEAVRVFEMFLDRYLTLANNDPCCAYVSIFHNWGEKAGASIYHPHYQMIAIPVVPPDVSHSLNGSERFFKKHKKCVHCEMIKYEKKEKKRIIYENKEAIAFVPFIAREPFELRIFPKKHFPYFEDTPNEILIDVVDALQTGLLRIEKQLKDPDYNFFFHTAPIKNKNKYHFYHWHIEVQPKISISAGFELGTGIEITVVDPNEAAKILRG